MSANVRKILVTGASSSIGAATARAFAREGCAVWITYTSDEVGARTTADDCLALGAPEARVSRLDLRSATSIDDLVAEVESAWGSLNTLVNNGAVCPYIDLDDIDFDEWDAVLETNARGTFFLSRAAIALLRRADTGTDRSIVNLSSIAAQVGALQTAIHYAASKAAILAITKSMARKYAAERIRVNAVCPGPIDTRITRQLDEERFAQLGSSVPLGRYGTSDEVAWIIASLASPNASFVTGATYDVNGGVRVG